MKQRKGLRAWGREKTVSTPPKQVPLPTSHPLPKCLLTIHWPESPGTSANPLADTRDCLPKPQAFLSQDKLMRSISRLFFFFIVDVLRHEVSPNLGFVTEIQSP